MRREQTRGRWELAVLLGILAAAFWGCWLDGEQAELADRVVRLHVIAESDRPEDQALKLAVRDRVLEVAEDLYPEGATMEQAKAVLERNLPALEEAGREAVTAAGRDCSVTARLECCWFPTKEYEGFALPAGNYTALRVVVGRGEGHNWWCVAFPPLCLGAASETVEEATEAGLFTRDQARLITEDGEGYVLKFRALELLGELKGFFQGR